MNKSRNPVSAPLGDEQRKAIARWTHMWGSAASLTLEQMDASWDEDDPVGSIGRRDVLSLVLLDAVRNTYRGAKAVLGSDHPQVLIFEEIPDVKDLRDRFEHFDEYLRGAGRAQRNEAHQTAFGAGDALTIVSSEGGGSGGHTIRVRVRESAGDKLYVLQTRTAVRGAGELARAAIDQVGLLDERHLMKCKSCASLEAKDVLDGSTQTPSS